MAVVAVKAMRGERRNEAGRSTPRRLGVVRMPGTEMHAHLPPVVSARELVCCNRAYENEHDDPTSTSTAKRRRKTHTCGCGFAFTEREHVGGVVWSWEVHEPSHSAECEALPPTKRRPTPRQIRRRRRNARDGMDPARLLDVEAAVMTEMERKGVMPCFRGRTFTYASEVARVLQSSADNENDGDDHDDA